MFHYNNSEKCMQEGDGHHEREGWGGRCDSLSIKMKLYSLRTTADYINLYTQHLNSLLDSVFSFSFCIFLTAHTSKKA